MSSYTFHEQNVDSLLSNSIGKNDVVVLCSRHSKSSSNRIDELSELRSLFVFFVSICGPTNSGKYRLIRDTFFINQTKKGHIFLFAS